ncbi:phage antirepressor protein [bacterium]|nr:phage antirepressor protein [bacterium]
MDKEKQELIKIAVFNGKRIRKILYKDEWYFSIIDVVSVLTNTSSPRRYWSDLKRKLSKQEGFVELYEKVVQLKLESSDGKKYLTDVCSTETMFRVIQSIASPKVEPLKRWLAKVGFERIQEIEDPEIASKRMRSLYKDKGYPDDWIDKRLQSITVREKLTNEWQNRGVREQKEYAILTAEISQATFGVKPFEHKKIKNLKNENLRDHMTDLELIFNMLGEASTNEIAIQRDARGFIENKEAAKDGGKIAGKARVHLEKESEKSVVSSSNYKHLSKKVQKNKDILLVDDRD